MSSLRVAERGRGLRRSIKLGLGVVLLGAGLAVAGFALAGTTVVTFTSTGPQPSVATVNWDDTVKFTNADTAPYTLALADDTGTVTQTVPAAGSYAKVFNGKAGSHRYTISGTKKYSGSVSVKVTGTVSLTAAPASVVYGSEATLSGTSTYGTAPVTIQQAEAARGSTSGTWSDLSTITPAADGSFSLTVTPSTRMRYRAITAARQLSSKDVTVAVKPRITARIRPRTLTVSKKVVARAHISPATAATTAYLMSHSPGAKGWRVVAHARVKGGAAKVNWAPNRGGKYKFRVEVHGTSLASGFVPSDSPTTRVKVKWQAKFALKAKPAGHASRRGRGGFQLAPRFLRAHAGRVTLVLKNLDSHPHNIALKGRGVNRKGRIVSKGGTSRVAAKVKPGTYTFYSSVSGDSAQGSLRVSR
jgi:plastocyanin